MIYDEKKPRFSLGINDLGGMKTSCQVKTVKRYVRPYQRKVSMCPIKW